MVRSGQKWLEMKKMNLYSGIMKRKRTIINYVFNFTGGTPQVISHVNKVEQHFHNYPSGEVVVSKSYSNATVTQTVSPGDPAAGQEVYADRLVVTGRGLRIYYPGDAEFQAITTRLGDCKNAIELANVVVNEILEHTILDQSTATTAEFIATLLEFTHFTRGTSVSNMRQQIQKQMLLKVEKRREK